MDLKGFLFIGLTPRLMQFQVPAALKTNLKLPHDIDYYVFSKVK